jgi:D-alanyl-D-alanine carboxypeptidase
MIKRTLPAMAVLVLLALKFTACSKAPSEPQDEPTLADELQAALDAGVKSFKGKGVSAAVIMPDGSTWVGTSGVSFGTTPITRDMRFAAGSIGKIFTATTILQLAEEGKLTLDDSLYEWLPPLPYVDSTITIRQLLNHTSGLDDIADTHDWWQAIFADPSRVWTPEETVRTFNREPLFPKGTGWNYSTTGYALLRTIIEEIIGKEISTVNQERFWVPLGLDHSFTSMGSALPPDIAHSWYDLDGDGTYDDFSTWPRTAFVSGIGGEVWSNAEDLAKWARALFYDKTVLSQASLDQMLTFHSPCTGEEYVVAGYGLGAVKFNPQLFDGLYAIGHSGNAPGYAAASVYLPNYDVCIGLVDNTEEGESVAVSITNMLNAITSHLEKTR